MKKFLLKPNEHLLVNDPYVTWIKGATMKIPGQLKLTENRIVFVKNATPFLKLFFKSHDENILLDIPLSSIQKYSLVDFGKTKRLMIENGINLPLTFATPKYEIFAGELKRLTGKL